jgi:hypothetical protein
MSRKIASRGPAEGPAPTIADERVIGSSVVEITGWLGTYGERLRAAQVEHWELVVAASAGTRLRANHRLPWLGD